jgi:hypothetical protein
MLETEEDVPTFTILVVILVEDILIATLDISNTVSSPIDMIELTETEDGFISETDSVIPTDSCGVFVEIVALAVVGTSVTVSVIITTFDTALV